MRMKPLLHAGLCLLLSSSAAWAQDVVQPAESMRGKKPGEESSAAPDTPPADRYETQIKDTRPDQDSDRIGSYNQPRWSTRRRFPTTRVYVIPEDAVEFEWWLETKTPFSSADATRYRSLWELEFGLGHHLQLDLYLRTEKVNGGEWFLESERVELRWALADWGVLWGNPTLYFEWIRPHEGVHKGEIKLLLGNEISPRWFWGANLSFERELGGSTQENEYALTGALAYALVDGRFSVGAEVKLEAVDTRDNRFNFDGVELLIGPSIQWRPTPRAHFDLVALIGAEAERSGTGSYDVGAVIQPTLVFGWEL
jgi:hypothetical protein